jgi:ABC-type polysaccharide/polyol phosphate export permease
MNHLQLAVEDFKGALSRFSVWRRLGVLEVKQRYQRSVLGPWWVSISMLIFIGVLGTVFSRVFSVGFSDYIPYFSAGYLLWLHFSSSINESTELFRQHSGFIKQIRLPYTLYVFKLLMKNSIIFFHNFAVYVLIVLAFQVPVNRYSLLAIPGFILLSMNIYWISLIVSLISVRFRDMVPIINSCVQVMFFATPISWDRKLLGSQSKLIKLNPVTYFIDVVREPLLGRSPALESWVIVSITAFIGILASLWIFSRVRSRIPFWVD